MGNKSLRNKVYKNLRTDILTGKIQSGTRITEISVAKDMGVSRTPVREALQKLSQEKLITAIPRAGYIIEDLSDDDLKDLFSTRKELELITIKKAMAAITVEELKALDDNLERSRACIKAQQFDDMTGLDMEYYSIIYKASRSKTLYRLCKNLNDLVMKYRHRINLEKGMWNETIEYHISLYQALIAKDENMAANLVNAHAAQTESYLLQIMQKIRSDSFSEDDSY